MTLPPMTPVSVILDNHEGQDLLAKYLPELLDSPYVNLIRDMPLEEFIDRPEIGLNDTVKAELWAELHTLNDASLHIAPPSEKVFEPDLGYEDATTTGTAQATFPTETPRWSTYEIELRGPSHGNPFIDVELTARFTNGDVSVEVGGFYDGDGVYRVRFLPQVEGRWTFRISSTARSLDSVSGSFDCVPALPVSHGPVGVVDGFHFAHADGTRYAPIGTTAYAWTHQNEQLEQQTLRTLAATPFNKVRMCVFPKSYVYNENEPRFYPFEGKPHAWDTTLFRPEFFRHLENRIRDLDMLGIQADLILFHPYDRWGFSALGRAGNDRYAAYLTRRLAAFPNVWWSMANEYDLMRSQTIDDWERLATIVRDNDHVGHLQSIHNFQTFYDYSRPWITHCSVQRIDAYRTAENTTEWRGTWSKPVVIDECGYEGDLEQAWGNLTGKELVRRAWEGAVRGGYVAHGETYTNERNELWWSKGGTLVGSSPERMGFLARLIAESPTGTLEPVDLGRISGDLPWGGVDGRYYLGYLGLGQSRFCTIDLPGGGDFTIDVIDTWGMAIERVPGIHSGTVRVALPARPYTALRLIRVED